MRKLLSVIPCMFALTACSGGGGGVIETQAVDVGPLSTEAQPVSSLPLYDLITTNGVEFPGNPSLVENPSTKINIAPDFTIKIFNDMGTITSVRDSDLGPPIAQSIPTYYTNDGRDAVIFLRPRDFSEEEPIFSGFDYTAFGLWLAGASEDIRGVTGPFEVADAGTIVVGTVTDPAALPTAGFATYFGDAVAIDADCLIVNDLLHGNILASVDFGSRQISTSIDLNRSNGETWGNIQSGPIDFAGGSNFDGLNAVASNGMTGHVHGFFAGPSGEEIAGQFHLEGDGEQRVIGTFAAFGDSSPRP